MSTYWAGCSICSESLTNSIRPPTRPGDPPVTLPNGVNTMVTPCGHAFHAYCVTQWMSRERGVHGSCPNCRKVIPSKRCSPLYLDNYESSLIGSSAATIDSLAATIDTQAATIDSQAATIVTQAATIDSHEAAMESLRAQLSSAQAEVDNLNGRIEALSQSLADKKTSRLEPKRLQQRMPAVHFEQPNMAEIMTEVRSAVSAAHRAVQAAKPSLKRSLSARSLVMHGPGAIHINHGGGNMYFHMN